MSSRRIFQGKVFVLADGAQVLPNEELIDLIIKHGGSVTQNVNDNVNYVVSSDEMTSVWGNPFKLQFFPSFESQVLAANMLAIPIVSGNFVQVSIQSSKLVDIEQYLIFGNKDMSAQSKLDPRVQDLVRILFDKAAQQQAILELSLDSSKVGNITESNIKSAYKILSDLENAIQLKTIKRSQDEAQRKIQELSKEFYRIIPHTKEQQIENENIMKEKITMLEALTDIRIAASLMKDTKSGHYSVSPIDINYKKLKTKITPLERWTREYDMIADWVQNSHAQMHNWFTVQLEDVFEIEREGESEKFKEFENLKHHRLLCHGSRLANWVGILSQGLRIAPPEAPVTGYFLGKGVYFADMCSKSAEYCRPSKENPTGLMLLCDVALGRPFQLAHTKFIGKEDLDDAGFHSVKGCGELGPDPAYDTEISEGVILPLGKEGPTGVSRSELKHSEFIVYDVSQIKMKYLLKLKIISNDGKDIKAASLVNAN